MLFASLVDTSRSVSGTRSRLKKIALLADCLRRLLPEEIEIGVQYLMGELPGGRMGLGPAMISAAMQQPPSHASSRTLTDIDAGLARIGAARGSGSQSLRRRILGELFAGVSAGEQEFLARLILGELRQGALEGIVGDALAAATGVAAPDLRRAVMLAGSPAPVAFAVLTEGAVGLQRFRLRLLQPVKPMLAQPAENAGAAVHALGRAAAEYKLDGARIQIHKLGNEIRVFTRRLNDVTPALPEVVAAVRALPAGQLIVDGEVIALRADGRPQPFQMTMRRFGRKANVESLQAELPLRALYFDCLHLEGEDLIDQPAELRFRWLNQAFPPELLMPRRIVTGAAEAEQFLSEALAAGHEGMMVKSLDAPYAAGSRGAGWLKVKPTHTLDLVILAAEWGSGRRRGWLSNLHLGARDPASDGFVMLGKTFKGLTDTLLAWQTEALLARAIGREGHVVHVRPELVVEIAFNDLQSSPQYPAGLALRFARVRRYRNDKAAREADTIDTVRAIHRAQVAHDGD